MKTTKRVSAALLAVLMIASVFVGMTFNMSAAANANGFEFTNTFKVNGVATTTLTLDKGADLEIAQNLTRTATGKLLDDAQLRFSYTAPKDAVFTIKDELGFDIKTNPSYPNTTVHGTDVMATTFNTAVAVNANAKYHARFMNAGTYTLTVELISKATKQVYANSTITVKVVDHWSIIGADGSGDQKLTQDGAKWTIAEAKGSVIEGVQRKYKIEMNTTDKTIKVTHLGVYTDAILVNDPALNIGDMYFWDADDYTQYTWLSRQGAANSIVHIGDTSVKEVYLSTDVVLGQLSPNAAKKSYDKYTVTHVGEINVIGDEQPIGWYTWTSDITKRMRAEVTPIPLAPIGNPRPGTFQVKVNETAKTITVYVDEPTMDPYVYTGTDTTFNIGYYDGTAATEGRDIQDYTFGTATKAADSLKIKKGISSAADPIDFKVIYVYPDFSAEKVAERSTELEKIDDTDLVAKQIKDFPTIPVAFSRAKDRETAAYTLTFDVGGTTVTLNKDSKGPGKADVTDMAYQLETVKTTLEGITANYPLLTVHNLNTLTANGTLKISGAYLKADQTFTFTAAELAAGKAIKVVYKDNTERYMIVKGAHTLITASQITFNDKYAGKMSKDNNPFGVYVDGKKITKGEYSIYYNNGAADAGEFYLNKDGKPEEQRSFYRINIHMLNDYMKETYVTLAAADGVKAAVSLRCFFPNQIFPVEMADGSFIYVSVNIETRKDDIAPLKGFGEKVGQFSWLSVGSSVMDAAPLTSWNTSDDTDELNYTNATLFVDYTLGRLTNRTTTLTVLNDGVTPKTSVSVYGPNPNWNDASFIYVRWPVSDSETDGVGVKYTRFNSIFPVKLAGKDDTYFYTVAVLESASVYGDDLMTAINTTWGGQSIMKQTKVGKLTSDTAVDPITGDNIIVKANKDNAAAEFGITSYYAPGTLQYDRDKVLFTLRFPKGVTITDNSAGLTGSLKIVKNTRANIGNTMTDGCVDYVFEMTTKQVISEAKFNVAYPLTNKDGKASGTNVREFKVTNTWSAKSYAAEKKVTMAGITVPNPINEPEASAASSSAPSSSAASSSKPSSDTMVSPGTGSPFNAMAYGVTIISAAFGAIATLVISKKKR